MGKSILEILAESERLKALQKNNGLTNDALNSPYGGNDSSFGEFYVFDYSNDSNFESQPLSEIADQARRDRKDLNLNPPDTYPIYSSSDGDVSVIDMPSIDDISEDIYLDRTRYNKYSNENYVPYENQLPLVDETDFANYGDYINEVKRELASRGYTLADYFLGTYGVDDSPIGVIAGDSLNNALQTQLEFILKRETIGMINNDPLDLLRGGNLFRKDYDISVPATTIGKAAEFLIDLQGGEVGISYIPNAAFGFDKRRVINKDGSISYFGSDLPSNERLNLLLKYTGKGQRTKLMEQLRQNIYNQNVKTVEDEIEENTYIQDYSLNVGRFNVRELIATTTNTVSDGNGAYEPYGVSNLHKKRFVGELFSNRLEWKFNEDPKVTEAIGWIYNPTVNRFDPKSLLFKTQKIANNPEKYNTFIDMSSKEFVSVENGEAFIISRGDATTASGDYKDDDGYNVSKGEYFRVWTKERGYNRLSRTLRHRGLDNGDTRSVLNPNGMVNIAPTTRVKTATNGLNGDELITRYMFSIENLAWADNLNDLPFCEQGPGDPVTGTRGRIMWFPPYNLDIAETVQANWTPSNFIGRGEPIYTYNNTERSATLTFSIIVDHPNIVNKIVGQKTEFWERYFKGDKLIEEQAINLQALNNQLSQNEIDELEKIKKRVQPKEKQADEPSVTPRTKNEEVKEEANNEIETNDNLLLPISIYFPNNETTLPRSVTKTEPNFDSGYTLDGSLNFTTLSYNNVGYEDGGLDDDLDFVTSDGYSIKTGQGIKYIKNKTIVNGGFTYNEGKIKNIVALCSEPNAPRGYRDSNNNGFNVPFYFRWKDIMYETFKKFEGKKVDVTFIGNASAAIPPQGQTNDNLSRGRAQNTKEWFEKNVIPMLESKGLVNNDNIQIFPAITFQGDLEDIKKKEESINVARTLAGVPLSNFCEDCDPADDINCKKSRRVDIFIQERIDENDDPTPFTPPTGDTTIDEKVTDEDLVQDQDEIEDDVDDIEQPPTINPDILKKLVYTECDFFKYLETNEPLAYQTISERIKYFWPAYHSITPQGFNSRLTFLQQCLRQGDSIGRDGQENIKNLAFGRPPVCILRIGDFYHTRIIVESMSISYTEGMTWDLNPEGIGVQPMYCDISMNIKIIGGSSMSSPINRLQNALSFNYYANTEMYDGRSDSVVFGNSETETEEEAYGGLKSGKIVDGIRLSSIVNKSQEDLNKELAEIRKNSRTFLPNSTTTATNQVEDLGQVPSLLEVKKRLGLPLTDLERTYIKVEETTEGKFENDNIDEKTVTQIKNSLQNALVDSNSILSVSTEELAERGEDTPTTVYYDIFDQFLNASVVDPDDLTTEYKTQVADEYFESWNILNNAD